MLPSNLIDPSRLSPEQRRAEIAALLATALVRIRGNAAPPSPVGLAFICEGSVPVDPALRSPDA